MRHWICVFIALCLVAPSIAAQDPSPSGSTIFFLARDDTDLDGQVTDIDNIRLYEVGLDGTVLFVTPPEQHVLMFTEAFRDTDDVHIAWVVQEIDGLWLNVLTRGKIGAQSIVWISLRDYAVITALRADEEGIRWRGRLQTGEMQMEVQDYSLSLAPQPVVTREADQPLPVIDVPGRALVVHQTIGEIGSLVQDLAAQSPLDALWLYEADTQTLTALKTWLPIEPLLVATYASQLAVLGYELDGSMSLYTIDFSNGVVTPLVTQILSGLIDPPYTEMQWTADGTSLLLVGDSGDFVVSSIGRIEAVYALNLATGAFTRLSPEGTLIDRASVTSR